MANNKFYGYSQKKDETTAGWEKGWKTQKAWLEANSEYVKQKYKEYLEKNKSPDYVKQKITYKSDDYASQYQIFRKTKKPNSSSDFATTDMLGVVDTSTGASFIDNIFPNRKLYYMFRSVDRHGHVSNPTGTYQVEIVDDDGAIYLLISMIDYEKEKEKGRTKATPKRRMGKG